MEEPKIGISGKGLKDTATRNPTNEFQAILRYIYFIIIIIIITSYDFELYIHGRKALIDIICGLFDLILDDAD